MNQVYQYCRLLVIAVILGGWALQAQSGTVTVQTLTTSFSASGGVSVDNAGDIYVADFGATLNNANGTRVYKVLRDGSFSIFADGLSGASGNDFGPDGFLYQSNIAGGRISRISPGGQVSTFTTANILGPVGCVVDDSGYVFIANCSGTAPHPSIVKISPNASSSTILASGAPLSCPNGLTMDDQGNLYTCNFNNGNVVKITPTGVMSILAVVPGNNNGHLIFANGVLYVVARCANQIYQLALDGQLTLLAGSGARGNDDGPAATATFSIPNGIAASADGDTLYVNDALSRTGGCINTLLNPIVVRMITGVRSALPVAPPRGALPQDFQLEQNFPNPFNPTTTIRFSLQESAPVSLEIFNSSGQYIVAAYRNTPLYPGQHSFIWNGRDDDGRKVASGVYLYRLTVGDVSTGSGAVYSATRKMMLMR